MKTTLVSPHINQPCPPKLRKGGLHDIERASFVSSASGTLIRSLDKRTRQAQQDELLRLVSSNVRICNASKQGTPTGCGFGQAAMGPFYCPTDRHVYLDLSFWSQLETDLGASSADFARAYVIAHEYGHHVQTLTGLSDQVRTAQQRASGQAEANRYSVALELQADCYAGVWARNAASVSNGEVALEAGDLEAGMQTASAIGDDTLQRRQGGQVQPEGFTHGSSAQRVEWLRRGYEAGDPAACDTFQTL